MENLNNKIFRDNLEVMYVKNRMNIDLYLELIDNITLDTIKMVSYIFLKFKSLKGINTINELELKYNKEIKQNEVVELENEEIKEDCLDNERQRIGIAFKQYKIKYYEEEYDNEIDRLDDYNIYDEPNSIDENRILQDSNNYNEDEEEMYSTYLPNTFPNTTLYSLRTDFVH